MVATPEDHKRARFQGEAFARSYLSTMVGGGNPVELTESFAAGMVAGARAFLATFVSDKAAYDILQAEADRAGASQVRERTS